MCGYSKEQIIKVNVLHELQLQCSRRYLVVKMVSLHKVALDEAIVKQ